MKILLLSTYDLGHQPFGLASPAAWLKAAGAEVASLDLAVQPLNVGLVKAAGLIAFFLPMHTATRLAAELIPSIKAVNPSAHLCAYGLYAPVNEPYLRRLGIQTVLGGEFESGLLGLHERLKANGHQPAVTHQPEAVISLARQQFLRPDRSALPELEAYAWLNLPGSDQRLAGYTEASRGCKHTCRHCPIVPVYNGRFRIVQHEVVLADIDQQVAAGAQHITFGDPDFLNGPGHSMALVRALRDNFPGVTYDVTIKIEHLLKYDQLLPELRDSGCLFVTSAVEAVEDPILAALDKGHSRDDFIQVVKRFRALGLTLNPTFVAFTPWTTPQGYLDLLALIHQLGLVNHVAPIQYAIRLLIPAGSRLLTLPEIAQMVESFDESALAYPWRHPEPAVDRLYERVFGLVQDGQMRGDSRPALFEQIWSAAAEMAPGRRHTLAAGQAWEAAATPIPQLSESWY